MWKRWMGLALFVGLVVSGVACPSARDMQQGSNPGGQKPVVVNPPQVKPPDVKVVYAGLTDEEKEKSIGTVQMGLKWLASVQNPDGGWGAEPNIPSDIGNTCSAALTFVRSGHTPAQGEYKETVRRAVDFVISKVQSAPTDGLALYEVKERHQQTKLQMKLGPYVDTFLANLFLAEVKDKMPNQIYVQKVTESLQKCVAKIEKGQQKDGSWNVGGGWAPVISTSIAQMGLEKARDQGVEVAEKSLKGVQDYMRGNYTGGKGGRFKEDSAAGVQLYINNAALRAFADKETTKRLSGEERKVQKEAMKSAIAQLGNEAVMAGFGSNGGEEFLSYMSAGETLVRENDESWAKWNKRITNNLCLIQNKDGSWSGQHCITERVFCTSSAILALTCGSWAQVNNDKQGEPPDTGKVQPKPDEGKASSKQIDLVFAIDVSGSMEHIINAAQKKIWAIVNQMASAKPMPTLRIGLVAYRGEQEQCYGGTGFKVWDLSDDLDKVYQQLMALKTDNGNKECVGRAIYEATQTMSWNKDKNGFKVIFVLGNEPANQDTNQEKYGYKKVAGEAIKQDILINTTYCAQGGESATSEWQEIARLADGSFASISLQGKVVEISTPMDKELVELNRKLNETYVSYGRRGKEKKARQEQMDKEANKVGGPSASAERTLTKAGGGYQSGDWDLVEAIKDKDFKLAEVEEKELPEEMKKMDEAERKSYLEAKSKGRSEIEKQIQELGKKREGYLQEEMKKQQLAGDEFDQVILKTLRQQAEKKGFNFTSSADLGKR